MGVISTSVILLVGALSASGASGPIEGSQGTTVTLPATASAVTVSARSVLGSASPFAGITFTISQTANLTNQAVSVSWTGAAPTDGDLANKGRFDDNYVQMFECWSPPSAADPSPDDCEFGANELTTSVINESSAGSTPITRQLGTGDSSKYAYVDPAGSGTYIPFQPVDGSPPIDIPTSVSSNANQAGQAVWANPFFDYTTSNELDYARTFPDGTGSALFTTDTGLEAPGLGCGQSVTQPSGSSLTPKCWLVIVPRGTPAQENPNGAGASNVFVQTSPLSGTAWSNHIAVPLSFDPLGNSCQLGSNEDRIVGSELAQPAVNNWEPALCAAPGSPPYQFSSISEDQARQELLGGTGLGGPGMAIVSQPVDLTLVPSSDPVSYAPLTLSRVYATIDQTTLMTGV
jgi:hypothetical protein